MRHLTKFQDILLRGMTDEVNKDGLLYKTYDMILQMFSESKT